MEHQSTGSYSELTLRDYLRVIFRHKAVVALSVLVVSATVAFGLKLQTPLYVASVKMLVSSEKQTQAPYSRELGGYDRSEASITQSEIVKSAPVLERAVKAIHLDKRPLDSERPYASQIRRLMIDRDVKNFKEQISKLETAQQDYILYRRAVSSLQNALEVEPVRGTNLLRISVSDFDPLVAATLANVVSRSYVIFDLEQQLAESATKYGELHPTVTLLKGHLEQMTKTLNGQPLENIEAIGPATVKIISQASIPTKPQGRSKKIIFVLAVFLSFILGIILAFIFEYLDPSVRSAVDINTAVQTPLLATIPLERQIQKRSLDKNDSPSYLAAYHELACKIRFFVNQKKMKAFLFTGPDVNQGTTTIVSNLGISLAKDFNKRVLLIDAHYHQPGVHKNFDTPLSPGLIEVLLGNTVFSKACREIMPNLWMVSAGDFVNDPESLLDSQKMADIIEEAKEAFDIVLIDCADLRNYRDAISIARFTDAIALVVAEGKTRRPAITAAVTPLKENNFQIVGTILNRRTFALPKFVYDRV